MYATQKSPQAPADLGADNRVTVDLDAQIAEVVEKYPAFRVVDGKLHGDLPFRTKWKDYPLVEDSFELGIDVPADFPSSLPIVREVGTRTAGYPHVNPNGTFCLGIPTSVREAFTPPGTLLAFIESVIVPYLYAFRIWQDFGVYPFGDLDHGGNGVLQAYRDYFGVKGDECVLQLLGMNITGTYKGHFLCPCGSEKKLRQCHGPRLLELQEQKYEDQLYEFGYACSAYWAVKKKLPVRFWDRRYRRVIQKFCDMYPALGALQQKV